MKKRASGILMPITSLPSNYGIGTLGKTAYDFVDFLEQSGQKWWQILPLGPTSYADSPYQSLSSFAGNPYLIDLDMLVDMGLLSKIELNKINWGLDKEKIDYGTIYSNRFLVLYSAYLRGYDSLKDEIKEFRENNSSWIEDYALFMALKRHFDMKSFIDWPDRRAIERDKKALDDYRETLSDDINFFIFIQYLFFSQWNKLRAYSKSKGIGIIGDIPIYVALDSQDVWASSEFFLLDKRRLPTLVSGVPPDYFNEDGQLWGNPLYDWNKMKNDGYSWWKRRIEGASKLYDCLRFDHFRGLESYYCVKYGEKTAREGFWEKGPGKDFTDTLNKAFPHLVFTAEDLGYLTPEVIDLLKASKWPGMKVLEFAFDDREKGSYDPKDYPVNSVCYTGTHDNSTLEGWIKSAEKASVEEAKKRLNIKRDNDLREAIIMMGMISKSYLMIVPLQDWLALDDKARINIPGTKSGNWTWRLSSMDLLTQDLINHIKCVTNKANRI